jgi:putative tricarboxylic transport membrane protein
VFVLVGAYSVNNSVFDLGLTVAFGVLGYLMRRLDFEPAPLVLALILGPQLEAALRRSLIHSRGDLTVFFQRPISAALLALVLALLATPLLRRVLGRRLGETARPAIG